jgi:hypothetical protein
VGTHLTCDKGRSARDGVTVCWQNAPMRRLGQWFGLRDGLLAVASIGLGFVVGYLDSRPTWDDTGITVALLLLTSAMAAGSSGRRPWLWALLIGAWVPILEIGGPAGLASLTALAVSAVGALGGYALVRGSRLDA